MADNLPPDDSKAQIFSASGELLAKDINLASAFVTPFAAAVSVELEEFGLSKSKIDEIMLRSAKRFGARAVQRSQLTVIANIDLSPPSAAAYRSWAIVPDWFVLRML